MIKVLVWNGKRHEEVENKWGGLQQIYNAFPRTVFIREVIEEENKTIILIRPKI